MRKFSKSNSLFKKVNNIIPLASQTFSKSYLQYIKGQAPLFADKAKGCHIWDIDGNKYIDFINGLLPVILGYQYKKIDDAIKMQLKKGIIFSLSSPLEYELSQLLIKHIPCAEMVRFGKNGSDVTAGAIRLARAITKKDHVAVCGYHGWQDWYIGVNPRNEGVPQVVKDLVHKFEYNKIESLERIFKENKNKIAAIIMEPMNIDFPQNDFLEKIKELVHKNNALLIFDEVITGFRFDLGGAQKMFGVIPDLATFGKSMANGMPIAAIVGKKEYMKKMEDIFYSFTMGGETLSIVAAIASIKEIEDKNVIKYIWSNGEYLQKEFEKIIEKYNLQEVIEIKGAPCWQILEIRDYKNIKSSEIKSYILQEMINNGILWTGSHNMSFSHQKKDLDKLLKVYGDTFEKLINYLEKDVLLKNIKGNPIQGNYNVRKL